ncbi:BlaR1 family beta-lactam sensor/signal transducer [Clostridium sp. P21]|uniref:BlaR1 family beta-lactam sensor/signal transducer n=1 Tax=Clostridium muellerianum TaxID=2716538 RepID=A0A7Y0EGA4_9CLOT|nr:BlaR1 family beta-lactam sensor/signal transducer [Clostridium muellerianum]NMM62934.1 BlaR1 family beta-lactam sensor/signal transducer [Clostridium muellerianum]
MPYLFFGSIANLGFYFAELKLFNKIALNHDNIKSIFTFNHTTNDIIQSSNGLQDFAISVNHSIPECLNIFFMVIWITGIVVLIITSLCCNRKLSHIKKSIHPLENQEIKKTFQQFANNIRINRKLILGKSSLVETPITFGLFTPHIVLPANVISQLSENDIKYILLHELNHYKNKDILVNYTMLIFQALYWFNPLIWFLFNEMRIDREIACDISVLKMIDESCYIDYGEAIINFAYKTLQIPSLAVSSSIGGSKHQLKKRIQEISNFATESKLLNIKSILIFIFIGCLILSQTPIISAAAYDNNLYNFKEHSVSYEDLSSYFNGFDGSFVLYNLKSNQYNIYNKNKSILRVSPDSTYKIFIGLFGLESGIIQVKDTNMNWGGINYPYVTWNKNQNLYSAMQNSVTWYFQEIDEQLGMKNLQTYFNQTHYGNCNFSGGISNYWIESSLKISPVEQVQLLKNFYTNKYKFKEENIKSIKNAIKISKKDGNVLSGKTGTGIVNGKSINGWFIGYVEKNDNIYFFATNIQNSNYASGSTAAKITLTILKNKNIY